MQEAGVRPENVAGRYTTAILVGTISVLINFFWIIVIGRDLEHEYRSVYGNGEASFSSLAGAGAGHMCFEVNSTIFIPLHMVPVRRRSRNGLFRWPMTTSFWKFVEPIPKQKKNYTFRFCLQPKIPWTDVTHALPMLCVHFYCHCHRISLC